jgi:hypothetical protein
MIAAILIAALGSWGAMLFFPWWTMVIPCFIAGIIGPDRGFKAFFSGMIGVGFLWFILAGFADWQNDWIMTSKLTGLMEFNSAWMLYAITCGVGSLVGAFSCLTGYLVLGRSR